MSVNNLVEQLKTDLTHNKVLAEVLEKTPKLGLPNWYVGAGSISQTVWNIAHNYPPHSHIKDIDLVYFDTNTSYEAEDRFIQKGKKLFRNNAIEVEIRNQARVHLWYPQHFGVKIQPYKSAEDGIASWATTVTCIGVTIQDGQTQIFAPYGLEDLYSLVIRPIKKQVISSQYKTKTKKWLKIWPKLTIIPW